MTRMDWTVLEKMICEGAKAGQCRVRMQATTDGNAYLAEALTLVPGVAALVDELDLFQYRRLPRFTSSQQQHFDLIAQVESVTLQLILNLLVPLLPVFGL